MVRVVELYDRTWSMKLALTKICVNLFLHGFFFLCNFNIEGNIFLEEVSTKRTGRTLLSVFIMKINNE